MDEILLLDHQADFVEDDYSRHLLLLGGFGSGKTHAFISKAYDLASKNIGHTGILLEPTAPLLHDILIPEFTAFLEQYDIDHTLIKSPQPNLTIRFDEGVTKILLRSLENWQRLIGVNAAFIGTDEMDTVKKDIALMAYKKLQGRLRKGNVRQMFNTTTPEGFGAAYELFEKLKIGKTIRANTEDNPHLPQDFIDDLKATYPPAMLDAYMRAKYVNLKSGTVYSYYDRVKHRSHLSPSDDTVLHIGQDFNVGGCCSRVHIIRGEEAHLVDEFDTADTRGVIAATQSRYPDHKVIFYPDASGSNRKTNSSDTDIALLQQAGFHVEAPRSNGAVKDRINSVNSLFFKDRYFINDARCPKSAEALEQQAYDKNGEPEKFSGGGTIDDSNDALGYFIVRRFPIVTYAKISGGFNAV